MTPEADVTTLLHDWRDGNEHAFKQLLPLVYDELHQIAHHMLRRAPSPTLNPTAVVHEAYLRLVNNADLDWEGRVHFMAVAARAMRFFVVDYARRRSAQKRGGGALHQSLDEQETVLAVEERAAELLALDEALSRLETLDGRLSQIVEYRFFGGLTVEEIAALLAISERTVRREWRKAQLWLRREMDTDA